MKNNIIFLIVLSASCNTPTDNIKYPITEKDVVVDTYFGTDIEDPYRWLEDDLSLDTSNWVDSQNEVTFDYLKSIPYRDKLKSKLIFSLTGVWINKNKKNDFNTPHVHIKSNFSGIYFLETTKQNGTLQFYVNDAFSFAYNDNLFDTNEFNPSFFIEPKNNTLILFPSNLIHFVMPHYENNNRISLAFNIDIEHG